MRVPWRFPWRLKRGASPDHSFRFCDSGVAAIEFVLVFPLLVGILVAGNELARYIRARQQLNDYAVMVAYDIAGASADVTVNTLGEMFRRFGLVAPELIDPTKDAWPSAANRNPYFTIGVTMVEMVLDSSNCTNTQRANYECFKPKVRWSFGNRRRACGDLAKRVGSAVSLTSLPADALKQPNAVVVVDVSVTYQPIFSNGLKVGGIGYEFDLGALNSLLTKSLVIESWQTVRNWRGVTNFPGLSGVAAGGWQSTPSPCPTT